MRFQGCPWGSVLCPPTPLPQIPIALDFHTPISGPLGCKTVAFSLSSSHPGA